MGEEPQLPPIPAISDEFNRKDRVIERKYSVIKCESCQVKYTREFKAGDFTFKKLDDEECNKCNKKEASIVEIYSEWVDPKKEKKKKK
jgi:5-methylcytosine-specific restriction endonuclease McrBC GTP-binding regulatory subunit McrB